ncbi:hypothetical protein P154DRAFT_569186 [Amniculicola lignicola CBS 123094]|uniref:Uncharacterized protein n=1 Tax=Amniculicola lignicola CBS 123094 TaxID=1392246 RepID=A0A6A5X0U9_9PLEO|nr:hypothetical protein P154DRAFT_569186 [Amniculicola lignicola CBS 123094]
MTAHTVMMNLPRDDLVAVLPPPTLGQDKLVTAVALTGKTQVPVMEGGPVMYEYAWSPECTNVIQEIFDTIDEIMALIPWATAGFPETRPKLLQPESGYHLHVKRDELGFLVRKKNY